jgi:hypothetical protein
MFPLLPFLPYLSTHSFHISPPLSIHTSPPPLSISTHPFPLSLSTLSFHMSQNLKNRSPFFLPSLNPIFLYLFTRFYFILHLSFHTSPPLLPYVSTPSPPSNSILQHLSFHPSPKPLSISLKHFLLYSPTSPSIHLKPLLPCISIPLFIPLYSIFLYLSTRSFFPSPTFLQ